MTKASIYNPPEDHEHALALLHIGMILADYSADDKLPVSTDAATEEIYTLFSIDMNKEPDIITVRNKMVAIIELLNNDGESN